MNFLEPLREEKNFAQRSRRGSEMFSVLSVIKWFGNSKDKTPRELCVKRS